MKSYYKQLEPHVLNCLTSFQTDFTLHDWKQLKGYQDNFIYAVRESGTDLFFTTPLNNAVNDLIQLNNSNYFNKQGYKTLLHENYYGHEMFYHANAIMYRTTNKLYFYGNQGKVIKITKTQMNDVIEQEINKPIAFLKSIIKTNPNVKEHIIHLMNQM